MRLPHLFICLIFFISSKYLSYLKWYRTLIILCIAPRNRRYFFHITAMENAKSEREGETSMYCLVFTLYSHKQMKHCRTHFIQAVQQQNQTKQKSVLTRLQCSALKSLVALALTVIICKRWSDKKRSRRKRQRWWLQRQQRWKRWMERDNY